MSLGLPAVSASAVDWGDYDGDGDLDLALAGDSGGRLTRVYRNDGGGVFVNIEANFTAVSNADLAWADFDLDGDLDLAIAGSTNGTSGLTQLYRNIGNDDFENTGLTFVNVYYPSIDWGDYDNDGDPDLYVGGFIGYPNYDSHIYRNDGGTLVATTISLSAIMWADAAWGDYDNDGDLDLLLNGCSAATCIYFYRNDNGAFNLISTSLPVLERGALAWGDYDNDGDLDLAMFGWGGNSEGSVGRVYRNDGNGTFTNQFFALAGGYQGNIAWADYDQDGWLDLVITGWSIPSYVRFSKIYHSQAGASFVDIGASLTALGDTQAAAWGDGDNDGDADLLLSSSYFRNNATISNTRPVAPSGLLSVPSVQRVTLSWSAGSDAHTAANALSYNLRVGTAPGLGNVMPAHANNDGTRQIPALGNVQNGLTATLGNLLANATYYWSVQAIDGAWLGSPFATEASFTMPAPAVAFSAATYTTTEASGNLPLTVTLNAASAVTVTVDYQSSPGTATPGQDYQPISGTLVFAPGTLTQTLSLSLLDDLVDEFDETLILALSNPVSLTLGTPNTATVTLTDNALTVTHPEDLNDGQCTLADCSLREAVIAANGLPGANVILVPTGIYTLTTPGTLENAAATGDLDINGSLRLVGAGLEATVIDGGAVDRVFEVRYTGGPLPVVTLSGVTILNGHTVASGGGVLNAGTLVISDTLMTHNAAAQGGGLWNESTGSVQLVHSAVISNTANSGGGLANEGQMRIAYSTIADNQSTTAGGGISSDTALTLTETLVASNHAGANGGGLYSQGGLTLIDASQILSNTAGAGGGGGYWETSAVVISLTTVANNTAGTGGGGLWMAGQLTATNSTLSGNAAGQDGGGLHNSGQASLSNVTITGNQAGGDGGGLSVEAGTLSLRNTLVGANADAGNEARDCAGAIVSQGYNLIEDTRQCSVSGITSNNVTGLGPALLPLGSYGGPTLTQPPTPASPAIDTGHPITPGSNLNSCWPIDQRGELRPLDGDLDGVARCDIGAVEVYGQAVVGFSLAETQVWESAGPVAISVTLNVVAAMSITVDYSTTPGSATADLDYVPMTGTLVFTPGVTSQLIAVPIISDTLDEVDEWLQLHLTNPVSAALGSGTGLTITVLDDDGPVSLSFSAPGFTATEDSGIVTLTVQLSAPSGLTVTSSLLITPGTAGIGDYHPISASLVFAPGETTAFAQIELVNDTAPEPTESFLVTLQTGANAMPGMFMSATITITDTDTEYRVFIPIVLHS